MYIKIPVHGLQDNVFRSQQFAGKWEKVILILNRADCVNKHAQIYHYYFFLNEILKPITKSTFKVMTKRWVNVL